MWVSATFMLATAAALSLVLAKPHFKDKAISKDVSDLLDKLLTELENESPSADEAIAASNRHASKKEHVKSQKTESDDNQKNALSGGQSKATQNVKKSASSSKTRGLSQASTGSTTRRGWLSPWILPEGNHEKPSKNNGNIASRKKAKFGNRQQGCGGSFSGPSGTLQSPNYPRNYDNDMRCEYHVTVDSGKVVNLVFTAFNVEYHSSCGYDRLAVFNGATTSEDSLLDVYCGDDVPRAIITTSNTATLVFETDGSVTRDGFVIRFETVDPGTAPSGGCGGSFSGSSGSLHSPNYPNNYDNDMHCVYHITVDSGKVIKLDFTAFDVEAHSSCVWDSLAVYNGATTSEDSLLDVYCGYDVPEPIITTSNTATLVFETDGSATRDGFFIRFETVDPGTAPSGGCGGSFSGSSGSLHSPNYPNNYDNDMHCVYHITVDSGKVIKLVFTEFEVELHSSCVWDSLAVYNGATTSEDSLLDVYCGYDVPEPIITTTNTAILVFETDGSSTRNGFVIRFEAINQAITTAATPSGGCGGSFSGSSGTLASPNYPNHYDNNMHCEYHVTVDSGKVIKLVFTEFEVELHSSCIWDSLAVFNGATTSEDSLLDEYCGYDVPEPIITTTNTATLVFETDSSTTGNGFVIRFEAINQAITTAATPSGDCGGSFAGPTGTITSPNYPSFYDNNLNCLYQVTVASGQLIVLDFTVFGLEPSTSCQYDSLQVFDGSSIEDPLLGIFCGSSIPQGILTSGNIATLLLLSDNSASSVGFSVGYTASQLTLCGHDITDSSGTLTSPGYPNNYDNLLDCEWTIRVPDGKIIEFTVDDFQVEAHYTSASDYVEILDGDRLLGKYSGTLQGGIPASTGNVVTIKFRTNGSGTAKGFSITFDSVEPPVYSSTSCGLVTTSTYRDGGKIIDGEPAPANALPWQVVIKVNGQFICGGSVIGESWILTAAHCFSPGTSASEISIVTGTINRNSQTTTAQTRVVRQLIAHEDFNDNNYVNDIALLKVDPLRLDEATRTICIPNGDAAVGTTCTISGWGNTVSSDSESPNYPSELLETELLIRNPDYCGRLYAAQYNYSADKQICGSRSGKDTCQGDSGGPFALLDGRRYYLEGITSYGFGCAQPDTPGAYTRVRAYRIWITMKTNADV